MSRNIINRSVLTDYGNARCPSVFEPFPKKGLSHCMFKLNLHVFEMIKHDLIALIPNINVKLYL